MVSSIGFRASEVSSGTLNTVHRLSHMRLSKRIYAMADKVPAGETAADIGTDHGYVPMLLIRDNISPMVIMSDISEGSLAKAKETFRLTGLRCEASWFRVGYGLDTVAAGEVDDIVIGGLGGFTIAEILDRDIEKSTSFHKLILSCCFLF